MKVGDLYRHTFTSLVRITELPDAAQPNLAYADIVEVDMTGTVSKIIEEHKVVNINYLKEHTGVGT